MLKLEDIVYPITFKTTAQPYITFHDQHTGLWANGDRTALTIDFFIGEHNKENPTNHPYLTYSYKMTEESEEEDSTPASATWHGTCKAEEMPLGAKLTGVQLDDGTWMDMRVSPRRIEVDDEVITLLLHASYQPNLTKARFGGEISMMRDAIVRWEK